MALDKHHLRIALLGKSGAGKSEVGRILQERFSCKLVRTGAICRQISSILFGNESKSSTQMLDDALTPLDPSIFLRASLRSLSGQEPAVIDSIRFISDYGIAKSLGFAAVRVIASDELRVARLRIRGQAFDIHQNGKHRSETELDEAVVEASIINLGDLVELEREVLGTASKLLK
jgi:dephospho-CoA kinase